MLNTMMDDLDKLLSNIYTGDDKQIKGNEIESLTIAFTTQPYLASVEDNTSISFTAELDNYGWIYAIAIPEYENYTVPSSF